VVSHVSRGVPRVRRGYLIRPTDLPIPVLFTFSAIGAWVEEVTGFLFDVNAAFTYSDFISSKMPEVTYLSS